MVHWAVRENRDTEIQEIREARLDLEEIESLGGVIDPQAFYYLDEQEQRLRNPLLARVL
jgi:hypothetical protein